MCDNLRLRRWSACKIKRVAGRRKKNAITSISVFILRRMFTRESRHPNVCVCMRACVCDKSIKSDPQRVCTASVAAVPNRMERHKSED